MLNICRGAEYSRDRQHGKISMGQDIYAKDGKKFTEMECIVLMPWFGKFRRGSKLRMGVIKKNYFGVKINVLKYLLKGWEFESES